MRKRTLLIAGIAIIITSLTTTAFLFIKEGVARENAFNTLHGAHAIYYCDVEEGADPNDALLSIATEFSMYSDRLMYVIRSEPSCRKGDIIFVLEEKSWWQCGGVAKYGYGVTLAVENTTEELLTKHYGTNLNYRMVPIKEAIKLIGEHSLEK